MAQLIEFFTKSGGRVLDPFAGVGGTLIGASIAEPAIRECVGIEISRQWTQIYDEVLRENPELSPQQMVVGDCIEVMDAWLQDRRLPATDGSEVAAGEGSFDFIATDPPYNIHLRQTMSGTGGAPYADRFANRRSDYNMQSGEEADLANLPDFDSYLDAMEQVFARCARLLRPTKYLAIIVRNAYQGGEYLFTHAELARRAKRVGLIPKGEIVWYQAGTRLRPYGYPYNYIPNISHQYIVILQRPLAPTGSRGVRRKNGSNPK
jgi:DNA modification methylase